MVIDLKVGKFTHTDAGQMHMYLNYARAHWVNEGENPPVGPTNLCRTEACIGRGLSAIRVRMNSDFKYVLFYLT